MQPTKVFNGTEWVEVSPAVVASSVNTVNQTLSAGVDTPVDVSATLFDTASGVTSLAPYTYTVVEAGYYRVSAVMQLASAGYFYFKQNGTFLPIGESTPASATISATGLIECVVGDVITLDAQIGAGGDIINTASPLQVDINLVK